MELKPDNLIVENMIEYDMHSRLIQFWMWLLNE